MTASQFAGKKPAISRLYLLLRSGPLYKNISVQHFFKLTKLNTLLQLISTMHGLQTHIIVSLAAYEDKLIMTF